MFRLKDNLLECHRYDQRDIPDKHNDFVFKKNVVKNLAENSCFKKKLSVHVLKPNMYESLENK